jgi:hypothetical protein
MSAARIHGELLKLGLDVVERTVSRLLPKRPSSPVADLATVPRQPCARPRLDRLLHRSDRSLARPLRLGRPRPPSPARSPLQCHGASHRHLDGSAGGSLAKRWCASGPCRDAQPHGLLAARSAAVDAAVRSAARDRCSAVRPAAPGGRGGRATTRSPLTASAYATLKARSTVRTCALKTTVSGRGSYSLSTIGTVEAYIARDCFQRGGSP